MRLAPSDNGSFSGWDGVLSSQDPLSVLQHRRHVQPVRQRREAFPGDVPEALQAPTGGRGQEQGILLLGKTGRPLVASVYQPSDVNKS